MDDQEHGEFLFEVEDQPAWTTVILFGIALTILVVAFVWFVMLIDPLLSDFFAAPTATPTAIETQGQP